MISKIVEFIKEYEKNSKPGKEVTALNESNHLIEKKFDLISEVWKRCAPSLNTPLFVDWQKSTPFRNAKDTALKEIPTLTQYPSCACLSESEKEHVIKTHDDDLAADKSENIILEDHIDHLKWFMSDNYKPPFHSISIASQLLTIWNLYRCFPLILDKVPSSFYAKIDYAAMCLIKTSLEKSYEIETSGFHSDRTLKSAEKRKAKKEQDKQPVLEAYYKVPNRDSIPSLNALVQSILELLKTSMQTPPSNKTVVRYLEDEGLADKHKRNI